MEKWVRGEVIGRGSFATVNLAIGLREETSPLLMAVKSAPLSQSSTLRKESEILTELRDCPQILRCFGHDITAENGQRLHNLFLEYAPGGSLARRGQLPESAARSYAAEILKGLSYIHQMGFVHCDVKLGNILLCSEGNLKIADFGLAKKAGEKSEEGARLRGTPLCMAPESVARSEYEPPSDIWSLGCAVVEMITGKPAWRLSDDSHVNSLLLRIGFGDELPEIPQELSEEARDFLSRCFVRDPRKRWTAEMLLHHPFVAKRGDEAVVSEEAVKSKISPRSVFDLMAWDSVQSSAFLDSFSESGREFDPIGVSSSPADRIRRLAAAAEKRPNWPDWEDGTWITIRKAESSVSGSVSSRNNISLWVLEEMVQIGGKREGISDSSPSTSSEFAESTSLGVSEIKQLEGLVSGFGGSDCRTRRREFGCSRGNTGCGTGKIGNIDRSKRRINGSGFFSFSGKNWDDNFTYSFVSDQLTHRIIK